MEDKRVLYFIYFIAIVMICLTMSINTNKIKEEIKFQVSTEAVLPNCLDKNDLNKIDLFNDKNKVKDKKKNPQQDNRRATIVGIY